jgi:glyoxylase-like metal-dependent hydrolase (beta-lactamase superfamily II)
MEALTLQTPFLTDLADAGFPRDEVDTVICTHLHFDHVGWNTMLVDGEWVPTFPNARYLLCRDEWEHWDAEGAGGYASTIDDAVRPVVDAGLADLVPSDHRVTDEIRLEATPGHTPGHVAVHVESGGRHALITGDLAHHPVQFAEPDWFADPDTDRAQSAATRRRLLAEHGDRDVLVIGTHFAPPRSGRLVTDGDGARKSWRFAAVAAEDV